MGRTEFKTEVKLKRQHNTYSCSLANLILATFCSCIDKKNVYYRKQNQPTIEMSKLVKKMNKTHN